MTQEKQREKLCIRAFKYSVPIEKRNRRILIFFALFYHCRSPPHLLESKKNFRR